MSDAVTPENASDPVERQVDAYNRKDLDAFLACYAADTVVEDAAGTSSCEDKTPVDDSLRVRASRPRASSTAARGDFVAVGCAVRASEPGRCLR
jgi:hypothetical protein